MRSSPHSDMPVIRHTSRPCGVVEDGGRQGVDAKGSHHAHPGVEIGLKPAKAVGGEEVGHPLPPVEILAEREHLDAGIVPGDRVQRRQLDDARPAPGRPQVEEQRPAAEVGEMGGAPLRILEGACGRGGAGMAAVEHAGRIGLGGRRGGVRLIGGGEGGRRRFALRGRPLLPIASGQREA